MIGLYEKLKVTKKKLFKQENLVKHQGLNEYLVSFMWEKKSCKMYQTISPIIVKEEIHYLVKLHPWYTKSSRNQQEKKCAGKEKRIVFELFLSPD